MRDPERKKYYRWGLMLFTVVAASIILVMLLTRTSFLVAWISKFIRAVSPVIWGLVIAYILNPVCTFVERNLNKLFSKRMKPKAAQKLSHGIGVVASMIFALLVIFGVIMLIVPQLIDSVSMLINNGQSYYETMETWVNSLLEDNPQIRDYVENLLDQGYQYIQNWMNNRLLASAQSIMTKVATGVYSVVRWVFNFLVGMIIAAYMLGSKKTLLAQCRKLFSALWSAKVEVRAKRIAHNANSVFGGFIRGKLLDSAIIGVLCYIGAAILRLPYTVLVATIVGITNVIPFFGPLIGAVPCALLILLVSPIKCLYFLIFILLLQQLDGNVIGPRILGDSIGLSSFWVLISITVFSSLFGFIGMLIGVPLFAVLYTIVKEIAEELLSKKKLPTDTLAYYESSSAKTVPAPEPAPPPPEPPEPPKETEP